MRAGLQCHAWAGRGCVEVVVPGQLQQPAAQWRRLIFAVVHAQQEAAAPLLHGRQADHLPTHRELAAFPGHRQLRAQDMYRYHPGPCRAAERTRQGERGRSCAEASRAGRQHSARPEQQANRAPCPRPGRPRRRQHAEQQGHDMPGSQVANAGSTLHHDIPSPAGHRASCAMEGVTCLAPPTSVGAAPLQGGWTRRVCRTVDRRRHVTRSG